MFLILIFQIGYRTFDRICDIKRYLFPPLETVLIFETLITIISSFICEIDITFYKLSLVLVRCFNHWHIYISLSFKWNFVDDWINFIKFCSN